MKRETKNPALLPLWVTEARAGPKLEARAQLLEAAATAFMRSGYRGTKLDDIAALNAVTKGQIYHYYRSKLDLYFDVVIGAFFLINEKVRPIVDEVDRPADERLHRLTYEHAMVVMTKFSFHKVALDALQHGMLADSSFQQHRAMQRVLEFRRDYQSLVERLIAEGIASGVFEADSVLLATRAALGALNWLTVWYDPQRSTTAARQGEIAQQTADFVLSGLKQSRLPFDGFARRMRGDMAD
jgi:AcrR family transcriptional regulator